MNLSANLRACALTLVLATTMWPAWAAAGERLRDGVDYVRVSSRPSSPVDVAVVEFFSLSCPHCWALENPLRTWGARHPKEAVLRVPVAYNARTTSTQRLFFALQKLDPTGKTLDRAFAAIHDGGNTMGRDEIAIRWLLEQGFPADGVNATYRSEMMSGAVAHANMLAQSYGINAVPNFLVCGQYLVSPAIVAASLPGAAEAAIQTKLFQVIDELRTSCRP
jgi:thiol:disulfide interchange protein DsbA